jgi:non-homologous end joining protein Ku
VRLRDLIQHIEKSRKAVVYSNFADEIGDLIRPYYLVPDGKVGHDAFAVIRETIRNMDMVAVGRVLLTDREHIIALEPLDNGLMGTLLRYPTGKSARRSCI